MFHEVLRRLMPLLCPAAAAAVLATLPAHAQQASWPQAGLDIHNTRHQKAENTINTGNVGSLQPKWATLTGGDVSATPAVDGRYAYFPDFAGNLFKVDKKTGQAAPGWPVSIASITNKPGNFARTTPAIYGDYLIFGTQGGRNFAGSELVAVHKDTGALVWATIIDPHPAAIITQSATVHGNTVYVGVASFEELFAAAVPGYTLSFRGSMAAINADTGQKLWQTYMAPLGFTGNAVWGSSPSIDLKRGQLYVATGNNYSAPAAFLDCVRAAGDDAAAQRTCLAPYPDNYFDSVVALDLKTGAVKWANAVIPFDVWTVECLFGLPTCPDPEGPDFDFGQAPIYYSARIGAKKVDLVGVGQKSGQFWALDADTGATVWVTRVSPGGVAGGMMWGSAFDGERIYTSSANSEYKPWTLADGSTTAGGIWSALDAATGAVIWQTGNPTGFNAGGAVTSANGVIYACSQDPVGKMYAMDARTGTILWSFASGGSCNAGAAVSQGVVYWGSGYAGFGPPSTPNNKFHAFSLP